MELHALLFIFSFHIALSCEIQIFKPNDPDPVTWPQQSIPKKAAFQSILGLEEDFSKISLLCDDLSTQEGEHLSSDESPYFMAINQISAANRVIDEAKNVPGFFINEFIEPRLRKDGVLGLFTKEDIKKGDKIMDIPRSLLIKVENLPQEEGISAYGDYIYGIDINDVFFHPSFFFKLLESKLTKLRVKYPKEVISIAKDYEFLIWFFDDPLGFNYTEFPDLEKKILEENLDWKNEFKRQYAKQTRTYDVPYPYPDVNYAELDKLSRKGVQLKKHPVFIPVIDLLNLPDSVGEENVDRPVDENLLQLDENNLFGSLYAVKDIKKDSELTMNYERDELDLLRVFATYGFLIHSEDTQSLIEHHFKRLCEKFEPQMEVIGPLVFRGVKEYRSTHQEKYKSDKRLVHWNKIANIIANMIL